jgi:hypothetical protein
VTRDLGHQSLLAQDEALLPQLEPREQYSEIGSERQLRELGLPHELCKFLFEVLLGLRFALPEVLPRLAVYHGTQYMLH